MPTRPPSTPAIASVADCGSRCAACTSIRSQVERSSAWSIPARLRTAKNSSISASATNMRWRNSGAAVRWSAPTAINRGGVAPASLDEPVTGLQELGEPVPQVRKRHLGLLAAVEIAQSNGAAPHFVLADQDRRARPRAVRRLHALRDVAAIAELDGRAGAP